MIGDYWVRQAKHSQHHLSDHQGDEAADVSGKICASDNGLLFKKLYAKVTEPQGQKMVRFWRNNGGKRNHRRRLHWEGRDVLVC